MPKADNKKTAQENKNETLENQLNQIREDIQFLRERAGQNGTGMSANFILDEQTVFAPKLQAFSPTSALYDNTAPNVGLDAVNQKHAAEHKEVKHIAEFKAVTDRIDVVRNTSKISLHQNVEREARSLLNKQGNVWEPVDSTRWKSAFENSIDPLLRKIDAEIKTIQEDKFTRARSVALGYPATQAGKTDFEAAKAHQIKLLEDYKASIKKESDHLEYTLILDAIQNQQFQKKNNGVAFGNNLTLHEHAREQLINRSNRAVQTKRLNTTLNWKLKADGGIVDLTTNPNAALPEGKYERGDRWSHFSYRNWMDSVYDVRKDGVSWKPVSNRFSKNSTIQEDIDGALLLFNKQTGQQNGYISAGKDVDPNYLVKFAQRATEKGYQMKLADKTRQYLQDKHPEKLLEIDHALGTGPAGLQLQANPVVRPSL